MCVCVLVLPLLPVPSTRPCANDTAPAVQPSLSSCSILIARKEDPHRKTPAPPRAPFEQTTLVWGAKAIRRAYWLALALLPAPIARSGARVYSKRHENLEMSWANGKNGAPA